MENGKVLFCCIFNIHSVVPAAVFALVMNIIAVNRPVTDFLMTAAQASEIGVVIIRCHHTCAVALGAFHLDAGGEGAVGREAAHEAGAEQQPQRAADAVVGSAAHERLEQDADLVEQMLAEQVKEKAAAKAQAPTQGAQTVAPSPTPSK